MKENKKIILPFFILLLHCFSGIIQLNAQKTEIRGFVDVMSAIEKDKLSFSLGEQDLFIMSELSDRFSFLGESVFKFTSTTPTKFSVSIERIVIKYNIAGNHNLLIGKHHTPVNYWNDTYHHGRVFFPTIFRPLLFDEQIIPIHTTGISFQGQNLGDLKFGYDLMLGNGIGSSDAVDNDKRKSLTAAVHIKPGNGFRFGLSWYNDEIAKGASSHMGTLNWMVKQNLFSGSAAYFGDKVEVLAEATMGTNKTDTTGSKQTIASYIYAGFKINEKVTPYIRFDQLDFEKGEIFYKKNNISSILAGIRFNINYLTVIKVEYQHQNPEFGGNMNKFTAQLAIGF